MFLRNDGDGDSFVCGRGVPVKGKRTGETFVVDLNVHERSFSLLTLDRLVSLTSCAVFNFLAKDVKS